MATERARHWEDVYRRKAEDEVSWFEPAPQVSLRLMDRVGAGPSSAVVDIGGGASRLVDALIDRGFGDVTVLDLSEAALAAARRRLGPRAATVDWVVADVTEWTPPRTFDLWHDRAAFHFLVDEADRRAYRERLLAALRTGGHVIIGTFAPDGPQKCSALPVVRHDADAIAAFLGDGFRRVATLRHAHVTPWGATQAFQFAAFTRTG
jgi:trans-aconitate methyltransferase